MFGEVFHKRVEPFIHPGPLSLIAVDDYGEEVVPYFMDHDAQHSVLRRFAIAAIFFRPAIVEADHGIFHPIGGFHALRYRVREGYREMRIGFDRMGNGLGRELPVQGISFFTIVAHTHYFLSFYIGGHSVHDEDPDGSPGEVANIVGFKDPGLFSLVLFNFGSFCFGEGNDFYGLFGSLCLLPAAELRRGQHLLVILAFAGSADNMVGGNGHLYLEITEGHAEFASSRELVVLPALEIAVYPTTAIPLAHGKKVIAVFGKVFITTPTAKFHTVGDMIVPVDLKNEFLPGF